MNSIFEMKAENTLQTVLAEFKRLKEQKVKVTISKEKLKRLEENELFVAATKEGFSKETVRTIMEPIFDYFIENIDLERIENSTTMRLIKIYKGIDLTSISGALIFDFLDEKEYLEDAYTPEFKKQIIFEEACELMISAGNISLNTAIKRTIAKLESENYISLAIEEGKMFINGIMNIINPLIEFYLENENEIIAKVLKIKK